MSPQWHALLRPSSCYLLDLRSFDKVHKSNDKVHKSNGTHRYVHTWALHDTTRTLNVPNEYYYDYRDTTLWALHSTTT